jgi:hypothetical protein
LPCPDAVYFMIPKWKEIYQANNSVYSHFSAQSIHQYVFDFHGCKPLSQNFPLMFNFVNTNSIFFRLFMTLID